MYFYLFFKMWHVLGKLKRDGCKFEAILGNLIMLFKKKWVYVCMCMYIRIDIDNKHNRVCRYIHL